MQIGISYKFGYGVVIKRGYFFKLDEDLGNRYYQQALDLEFARNSVAYNSLGEEVGVGISVFEERGV